MKTCKYEVHSVNKRNLKVRLHKEEFIEKEHLGKEDELVKNKIETCGCMKII